MSARRRFGGDSLDLLLDTVCSMFGAITLIAILVALLAKSGQPVANLAGDANHEMLQRKIAQAEADLEAARQLREQLKPVENAEVAAVLAEKRRLVADLARARARNEQASAELLSRINTAVVDFSSESKVLAADRAALERRAADLANKKASQTQQTAQLQGRAEDLGKQIGVEQRSRVVTLRFPKERARTKRAFSVIVKYGKVYPLRETSASLNKRSIAWTTDGDREVTKPIESLGWRPDMDATEIAECLRSVTSSEYYIAYFVYPDSIAAFRSVRERTMALGFDVGFELIPAENNIMWSARGTLPAPL